MSSSIEADRKHVRPWGPILKQISLLNEWVQALGIVEPLSSDVRRQIDIENDINNLSLFTAPSHLNAPKDQSDDYYARCGLTLMEATNPQLFGKSPRKNPYFATMPINTEILTLQAAKMVS